MVVYQASNATFVYESDTEILTQNWEGFSTSQEFKEAIDKTVDFVKNNPVKGILSNTQDQGVVKKEDTEYAASVMPKLFMSGLKGMAFVLPKDIFSKLSVKKFEDDTKGANIKMFDRTNEAAAWLNSL